MNASKTGKLIYAMRKQKNLTQKELAELVNVSDKAVCKWENGRGCPDITLLPALSHSLDVSIESLLRGELESSHFYGGNMNKLKIYRCKNCNNIISSTKQINAECCGLKLPEIQKVDLETVENKNCFVPIISEVDDELFVKFNHPMTKENYIATVIIVYYNRLTEITMYPEQEASFTISQLAGSKIYVVTNNNQLICVT